MDELDSLKLRIAHCARAYNKYLEIERVKEYSVERLLCLCPLDDRNKYKEELRIIERKIRKNEEKRNREVQG